MNVKIVSHAKLVNAVNARELHAELENCDEFIHWINDRIKQFSFEQGVDFIHVWEKTQTRTGATKKKEFFITVDMAKELAMVERNEKGRMARKYFIKCENELRELRERKLASNPNIEAMRKLLLLDSPSEWVKRFPDDFYIAVMKLHHHDFDGNKSTPVYCANITRRWIYNVIMPKELMGIIDENKRNEKIHQWLTTDAGQQRLSQQIGKITMVATMCANRDEFEQKCGVLFLGQPLQLTI